MTKDEFKQMVGEAVGEASVCWDENRVFMTEKASAIVDRLVNAVYTNEDFVAYKIGTPLNKIERFAIETTLAANGNVRTKTAAVLGISIRTLRNKLKQYRREA